MRDDSLPWVSLLLLGAVHGMNPAMGWLFAVARGLQERNRRALWRALGPLALGHAGAIAAAVMLAATLGRVLPVDAMRWLVAAALLAAGVDGLRRHRHVRLGGMRVSARELATWSFLMASAHGAGLMVLPFVLGAGDGGAGILSHDHHAGGSVAPEAHASRAALMDADVTAISAPLVHTLGYLASTVALAVIVYEKVGLRILRRAWINLDVIWAAAMGAAAAFAMLP